MIDGVIITKLKKIPDERGAIFHMLRNDDSHFIKFGENSVLGVINPNGGIEPGEY